MNQSSRLRFEVLVRDGFRCRYCGVTPKQATLTVDHVIPVSAGGPNEAENLVTACYECNFGKNDRRFVDAPDGLGIAYTFDAPVDAPEEVVAAITDQAMALQVAVKACGLPHYAIAAAAGISPSYLSVMQSGKRPISENMVGPLCMATGSNLIRQFLDLQAALDAPCEVTRLAGLMRVA